MRKKNWQKKNSNKSRASHRNQIVLALVVVLFLGVAAYQTAGYMSVRNDKERFAQADQSKQMIFDQLIQKIGKPIQIAEKDVCYNSEQGPFDDGRLWCQVASAAYFSDELSELELREEFESLVQKSNLVYTRGASGNLVFYGADNLTCALTANNAHAATAPALYLPENSASKQTIIVDCAGRAKAKHYPYID